MDEKRVVEIINEIYGLYYNALSAKKAPGYGDGYYTVLIRRDGKEYEAVYLVTNNDALPIPG